MGIKGKKLFVVRGSEDGIIGIFTNFKLALKRGDEYVNGNAPSYSTALKIWKKDGWIEMESKWDGFSTHSAQITYHFLNE